MRKQEILSRALHISNTPEHSNSFLSLCNKPKEQMARLKHPICETIYGTSKTYRAENAKAPLKISPFWFKASTLT